MVIVTGHETTGVPSVILHKSKPIYIPMPGVGVCLNTSQGANVALYEYNRQLKCNSSTNVKYEAGDIKYDVLTQRLFSCSL